MPIKMNRSSTLGSSNQMLIIKECHYDKVLLKYNSKQKYRSKRQVEIEIEMSENDELNENFPKKIYNYLSDY